MKYFASILDEEHEILITGDEESKIVLDRIPREARLRPIGLDGVCSLIIDNNSFQVFVRKEEGSYFVSINGRRYRVAVQDEKKRLLQALIKTEDEQGGLVQVKAPMPGLVAKIMVQDGQQVNKGDSLVIIEAMKMENEIRSGTRGTVIQILKAKGDSVDKGAVLLVVEQG
ncbi:MAG: biotin/lipoyl-binding protein [Calditrichaeota bacterium]|nr:biotin/lipoyl-binding protein [Calditrichota bacterium]